MRARQSEARLERAYGFYLAIKYKMQFAVVVAATAAVAIALETPAELEITEATECLGG